MSLCNLDHADVKSPGQSTDNLDAMIAKDEAGGKNMMSSSLDNLDKAQKKSFKVDFSNR